MPPVPIIIAMMVLIVAPMWMAIKAFRLGKSARGIADFPVSRVVFYAFFPLTLIAFFDRLFDDPYPLSILLVFIGGGVLLVIGSAIWLLGLITRGSRMRSAGQLER